MTLTSLIYRLAGALSIRATDRERGNYNRRRRLPGATALIALVAAGPAAAAPVIVDWDALSWVPAGNTNLSETYAIGNGNVTVSFTGNTAELDQASGGTDLAPTINSQNQGGLMPVEQSLYVATEYSSSANKEITITFDFTGYPGGVGNFAFTVFDIDASSTFVDQMSITAETAAGTVDPTGIVTSVDNTQVNSNTVQGTGSAPSSTSDGNVTFTFAQTGITQINILYSNEIGLADPGFQWINIHDFTFDDPEADVSLSKTVDNASPAVGDNVVYTLTVNNTGPDTAPGVEVTDQLPAGLTYVSDNGGGNYNSGTGLWMVGNIAAAGSASLQITATVEPNGPYANSAEVTALAATDNDSTPGNNVPSEDDQDAVTITPAEIGVAKQVSAAPTNNGDGSYTFSYTVRVENTGASAVSSLQVVDDLSATFAGAGGFSVVAVTSATLSVNGGYDGVGDTNLLLGTDNLAPAAVGNLVVTVQVTPGANLGPYNNQATASGLSPTGAPVSDLSTSGSNVDPDSNGDPGDNGTPTPVSFTEAPEIGTAKSVSAGPTSNGDGTFTLTYTVTVENSGDVALNGLQVVDDLTTTFAGATGFTVDSTSSADFTVNGGYDGAGNTNLLTGADSLATAATGTVDITVTVNPGANLGPYNNAATGSGTSPGGTPVSDLSTSGVDPDPDNNGNPGDNGTPTPVSFTEAPEIGTAKSVSAGPTSNGDGTFTLTYTVTVENSGDVALNGLQVVDDLTTTFAGATGFTVDSTSSADFTVNGGYDGAGNTNLLTGADSLATAATGTVDITVTVNPGANLGPYNNAATGSGTSPGGTPVSDLSTSGVDPDPDNNGNPGDNGTPTPVSFTEAPEIGTAKSVSAGPTSNGDGTFTLTYTVTVENSGDVALNGLQVVDDLTTTFAGATGFTVDSTSSADFTVNGGYDGAGNTNLLTGADSLATAASGTVDITVTVNPGANLGPYNNAATGSGTSPGGTPVSDLSTSGVDPDPDNNGDPGDNGTPTPVSFTEAPEIGTAKSVSAGPTSNGDGTFTLTYTVTVENSGDVALNGLQVVDDLSTTFAGATGFTVDSTSSADFTVNGGYDGSGDTNLLTGADSLATAASGTVDITVSVTPGANLGPYNNAATGSGTSPGGTPVSDLSTSGVDPDPDNNGDPGDNGTPTPVSFTEAPEIGTAKSVSAGPTSNGDGTFTLTYTVTVENSGDVALNGLQVVDDLSTTFAGATGFTVDATNSADFTVNGGYDGAGNTNLLTGADSLATAATGTVAITVTVTPGANLGPYNNAATGSGTSPGGTPVSDLSTSGVDPDPDNNGNPGDNGTPTPVSFTEAPEIGTAKSVSAGPTSNGDGTFTLTYTVTVENSGDVALNGLQVVDDLSTTFAGATGFTVDSTSSADFTVNGGYDGSGDTNLLTGADSLATAASGTVDITVSVTPGANLGPYNNAATGSGTSPGGTPVSDLSTSGVDPDPDNNGNPGDNGTPTPVSFTEAPEIGTAKSVSAGPTSNGDGTFTLTYTVTVENSGDVALNGLQVVDDLSTTFAGATGFTVDSTSSADFTVNGGYDGSGDTNLLTGADSLATAASGTVDITVSVTPGANLGPYNNAATGSGTSPGGTPVSDLSTSGVDPDPDNNGNPGDNGTPTPVSFTEAPEIGTAKSVSAGPTSNGDGTFTLTYTVTVENSGDVALNGLQVVDDLSTTFAGATGFTVDSTSSADFTVNGGYDGSGDTNLLTGADSLATAASGTVDITVSVTPGANLGPYNNAATGSGTSPGGTPVSDLSTSGVDPDPDNNGNPGDNGTPTPVSFTEAPEIGTAKSVSAGPTSNGDGTFTLTYTVTVENSGDVALNGLQVVDDLSTTFAGATGFTVDSTSSADFTVNGGYDGSGDTNLLTGADSLATAATGTVAITVTVTPGANLGPYNNAATGSGTSPGGTPVSDLSTSGVDPDPDNNGDPGDNGTPTPVSFTEAPEIGTAKSVSAGPTSNGDGTFTLTYTVTVENSGDVALNGLQVVDDLSTTFAGATGFTVDATNSADFTVNGGYDGSGDTNLLTGADSLATAATGTVDITVTVNPGANLGPYNNAATGSGTSPGGTPVSDLSTSGVDPDPDNNGDPGDNGTPTPVSFNEAPEIGAAKAVTGGPTNNGDGSYTLSYTVTVENFGDVALSSLQVTENLGATFAGATTFVVDSTSSADFAVNAGFNGSGDTNLLTGADSLATGASGAVDITVTVTPGANLGPYDNTASASGQSPAGTPVSDDSTDGADPDPDNNGDPADNNDVTPVSFGEAPQIGIAKNINTGPTANGDGSFSIGYRLLVVNSGDVTLDGVQVTENLSATFAGATGFSVTSATSADFAINPGFDGAANSDLLTGADTIAAAGSGVIDLIVSVTPGANLGPYDNSVTAGGTSPAGTPVSDVSTDGTTPDPDNNGDPGDNSAPTTVTLVETPRIGTAKSVSAGPTNNGNGTFTLTYTITVENSGDVSLSSVQVVEDLSATFAGATGFVVNSAFSPSFGVNAGFNGNADTDLLSAGNVLAPGSSGTVDVTVTVTPGANLGPYENIATATGTSPAGAPVSDQSTSGADPDPDNNNDPSDNSTPTPVSFNESPQIGAAKALSAGPAGNGDGTFTLTYTIAVENSGDVALNGLHVAENLSATFAGAPFVVDSVVSADFSVDPAFDGAGTTGLLDGSNSLAVGASGTIDVTVIVTPGSNLGPYDNSATASATSPAGTPVSDLSTDGADPDPDNNGTPANNSTPTPVSFVEAPGIGVAKSVSTGPASNGDGTFTLAYTIIVENTGDSSLDSVQVTDDLAATYTGAIGFVVDAVTSASFTTNPGYNGAGNINLLTGSDSLALGASGSIVVTVTVEPGANLGPYANTANAAAVSGGAGTPVADASQSGSMTDPDNDGDPTNNDQPTPVNFAEMPQIGAAKAITAGPVNNGDGTFTVTYAVTMENSGDVQFSVVQFEEDLTVTYAGAAGFIVDSLTSTDFIVNPGFDGIGDINMLGAAEVLAAGATRTAQLTVTVTPGTNGGPYANSVTATGQTPAGTPVSDVSTDGSDPDPGGDGPGDDDDSTDVSFALGTDATVDITDMSVPGDILTVTVTDADLNTNPTVAETVVVTVVNNDTGEIETLTLTETGPNTGVFTATVDTVFGTSAGTNDDGVFNTEIGHTLTVTYQDALTASGGMATLTDTDIVGNTPPLAVDDSAATPVDTPVAIPVLTNDADPNGHNLTITGVTQPANGTVTFTPDGTVIYTPNPGFTGTDTFTYTIDDGFGGTDTATVTVVVDNDTPTAVADSAVTPPSTPVVIAVLNNDTDPNNDPLSVVPGSVSDPANGSVVLNPDGTVTYTPDPGFTGTDTFTYQITDPDGNTDTAIVTVVVSGEIPQAVDDVDTTPVNTPVTVTVLGNDSDPNNDPLLVTGVTQPGNGTVVLNADGTVTYTPNPGFTGVDTFTYTIVDNDGNTDVATVTITVVGALPPVAEDDSGATPLGTPIAIPVLVNDSDPEGQQITIDGVTQPANGTVTFTADGTVIYTPNPGFTGTDTFTYTIVDEDGLTDTATVTVVVDNDTPTAVADSAVTAPATPVIIAVLNNDTDPNDDPLTVVPGSLSNPANGSVVLNPDGTVTYTPDPGFTGTDTFTYQITDPDGNTDTAIVTVIVNPDIPAAIDDADTTPLNTPITVNVLANDTDPNGDALTVSAITQPANGTAVLNPDGTVTYTPNNGFTGVDTFTYTIVDADGNTDVAAVTITVQALASVQGSVWLDANADDVFDSGENPVANWTVELIRNGVVVATTTSAADGSYTFAGVPAGSGYSIQLRHPDSGAVFGRIDDLTLPPGTSIVDQNLPVDPSGVVYDAVERTPVGGATLIISGSLGTPLPAVCVLAGQQDQITGSDGYYRFDLVLDADPACPSGGTYTISVVTPDGYLPAPSRLILPATGPLSLTGLPDPFAVAPTFTAPQTGDSTLYYFDFRIATGDPDVINNHIPLDPVSAFATIRVTKVADRPQLVVGDLASYTVTAENTGSRTITGIELSDRIPAGFSYVDGSARLDGPGTLTVTGQRPVVFGGIDLDAGEKATLRYMLRVGAGVTRGNYLNTVTPLVAGSVVGNEATATVTIVADPDFEETTIVGKVFNDIDGDGWQDEGEGGIPGVRLATVGGLLIETDAYGRYHIAAVDGGFMERGRNFIVKVDPATLPDGAEFTTENPRVQRITQGLMNRFDFGVRLPGQTGSCCEWLEVKISEIFFEDGSDEVRAEYLPLLGQLAERLTAHGGGMLVIEGSADAGESLGVQQVAESRMSEYTLTPRFAVRGTALSDNDKADLDRIAQEWRGAGDIQVISVGHTDNVRIAPQNRREFADNHVLSKARARTVADYLRGQLGLPESAAVVEGRGPDQPVADNATADGRALNRRVEVTVRGNRMVERAVRAPAATGDLPARRAQKVYQILEGLLGKDMIGNVQIKTGSLAPTTGPGQPSARRTDAATTRWLPRVASAVFGVMVASANAADTPCSLDDCQTPDGYAIQVISHDGPRPATAGDTAFAAQDPRRVDVTGRFLVKLDGGGIVWATEDPAVVEPRLAVHGPELALAAGERVSRPVAFHVYSNYPAFIERMVIEIFHAGDIDRFRPVATVNVPVQSYARAVWDGTVTGRPVRPGDELVYRAVATDAGGRIDRTDLRTLRAVSESQYRMDADYAVTPSGAGTGGPQAAAPADAPVDGVLVLRPPLERVTSETQTYTLTPRFDTRKTVLKGDDRAALDRIIDQWRGMRNVRVQAVGHTDNIRIAPENRHEFANNQVLSEARARSVADYVARGLGIGSDGVIAVGRGPADPVASNSTPAGRATNRRVELAITGDRVQIVKQQAVAMQLVDPATGVAVPVTDSLDRAEYLLRTRKVRNGSGEAAASDSGIRDLSAQGSGHALTGIYGQNHLVRQTIPVHGSRVRVHGEGVGPNAGLAVNGELLPLDTAGQFAVEYLLPVGEHEFRLEFLNAEGQVRDRARLPVKVDGEHMFIVALADLTLSGNDISGSIEPLSADDRYDEDFLAEGRLAFYLKGKIKGKYLVTAQLDTTEEELGDILGNLDEKDPDDVFRRLDPDRYYPVYGDDSTTYSDTDSMGRLYLRADWDKSNATWGNFHTDITGTEFGQYNRSLYGAKLSHQSLGVTSNGDAKTDAIAFVSEAQTALGHSEFVGTGGSLYYLRHTDLLPGSDKLRIEIRDRDSQRVRDNITLTRGVDYEVDEFQGRVILARPLMQVAQLLSPGLVKDAPLDGDEMILMADYEYIPDGFSTDKVSYGVRGKQWIGDRLALGGTWITEARNDEDYELAGIDATFHAAPGSFVKAEFAGSDASQTDRWLSSDGGLSFDSLSNAAVGRSGDAWGVEARVNSRELMGTEREIVSAAWYRRIDDQFSVARRDDGVDTSEYGLELAGQLTDRIDVAAIFSVVDRENDIEDQRLSVRADYRLTDRSTVSGEVRNTSETVGPAATTLAQDNDGTLAALRYSYRLTQAIEVYGAGQMTLTNDDGRYDNNDMGTVGATVALGERMSLSGEYSSGHRGEGALLALDYKVNDAHQLYGTYTQSADRTDTLGGTQFAIGHRSRLSDQTTVFSERQFAEREGESGVMHVFGLDFVPRPGWSTGMSFQRGDLTTREGLIDRDSATGSLGYRGDNLKMTSKVEYRNENGVSDVRQWLTSNRADYKLSEAWRLLARLNLSESDDQRDADGDQDARFVEAGLGAAYRPVDSGRLSLLTKYTYLYDLPGLSQTRTGTDQRSHVLALEGIYRLTPSWEVGGKLAQRQSELRTDRKRGEWFESTANFAALRGRYHLIRRWDGVLEYRWLNVDEADSTRSGWLIALDRHFGDHLKLGIGYNFTDFSDDLTNLDYDHQGWFINALGKY